jgi:hypothetical protein
VDRVIIDAKAELDPARIQCLEMSDPKSLCAFVEPGCM